METIVYLVRHSEPFKKHMGIEKVNESQLFSNIKTPLSICGEKLAEKISNNNEFKNIDVVWSSAYVRAMSTAKYFAYNNNVKVNVDERFGERIHGCKYSELPDKFEVKQALNENFKMPNGESQIEVRNRMYSALMEVINENKGKRILILTHSTAMLFLLLKWCKLNINEDSFSLKYNDSTIFNANNFIYCEIFKLTFDESNNVIDIKNWRKIDV